AIWKDVGLASALLLAFAFLMYAQTRSSWIGLAGALVCLFYGYAVRHNAALAVYPLALWCGQIAHDVWSAQPRRRTLRVLVIGNALFVALALLVATVNAVLVGDNRLFPAQQ